MDVRLPPEDKPDDLQEGEVILHHPSYPELYAVTTHGRVFSYHRCQPKELTPGVHPDGHLRYDLYRDGERDQRWGHHMVLEVFRRAKPSNDHQCRHLNGDPMDNRLENLRWGSLQENMSDAKGHGSYSGSNNSQSKLSEGDVREIRWLYEHFDTTYKEIAEAYDVSSGCIGEVVRRVKWKHVD